MPGHQLTPLDLAPQALSQAVLLERYAQPGEHTVDDLQARIARALAQAEPLDARDRWQTAFHAALHEGFMPAGRIQATAGTTRQATLINCFVQPIGDTLVGQEAGHPGVFTALGEVMTTLALGGGVGLDFSPIRPQGATTLGMGAANGPVPVMRLFDHACETVGASGLRRGALMGVLRCDHPDIATFIHAKDHGSLRNFNLSVAVTDAFMQAVQTDGEVELLHSAQPCPSRPHPECRQREDGTWVYQTLPARTIWAQIMKACYDHGEPGVLFLDRINQDNNLGYCEAISATNPCGEQPLPPYGCCCLGSLDLTRFVRQPFAPDAFIDEAAFAQVVRTAVRMLDNVLDLTHWPLPQQGREAVSKRRIGLGVTGLGDALIMLNLRYDSAPARHLAAHLMALMRDEAYGASIDLAQERGPFPLLDIEGLLRPGSFASRLPDTLQARIRVHGLRNAHLLSIAPAGTISLALADNVSNGIEPPFAWQYIRHKRLPGGRDQACAVEDHAWRLYQAMRGTTAPLSEAFLTGYEISASDHLAMVAAVAPFVDASISKTVNIPVDYPFCDFQDLYLRAWQLGLKGLTIYRPNAVLRPVLEIPDPASCRACT